jgi:hypothetical protein
MENDDEALVKGERQPEAIPATVPPYNLPPTAANRLSLLVFSISASMPR